MYIEERMFMVAALLFTVGFIILSYCIGYIKGFKKSKEIDDKILEELSSKYIIQNKSCKR